MDVHWNYLENSRCLRAGILKTFLAWIQSFGLQLQPLGILHILPPQPYGVLGYKSSNQTKVSSWNFYSGVFSGVRVISISHG